MKFTTSSQAVEDTGVKILTYGQAGVGKTMLVATLPKPVLISAESGLLSLRRANIERVWGVDSPGISYDIPTMLIEGFEDLAQAYAVVTGPHGAQFESVALDSISEIAEVILNKQKKSTSDPRKAYGELIEKTEDLVRRFRDIPRFNVYFSGKMEPRKDEISGATKYGPMMPGSKLGPNLPYFFDEVFRLGVGKDKDGTPFRYLQTQPDLQYEAKDRSGALAPMEYPHLGAIISKIRGISQ